jgi:hypothetical protein
LQLVSDLLSTVGFNLGIRSAVRRRTQQAFDVHGNTGDQHRGSNGGRDGWQESDLLVRTARTARDWPAARGVTDA